MGALLDLKTKLVTLAADITDDVDELECLADIETWYSIRGAVDAFAATSILSYSIGGRSVSRADRSQLQRNERELYFRILGRLAHGGMFLGDLRSTQQTVGGAA